MLRVILIFQCIMCGVNLLCSTSIFINVQGQFDRLQLSLNYRDNSTGILLFFVLFLCFKVLCLFVAR